MSLSGADTRAPQLPAEPQAVSIAEGISSVCSFFQLWRLRAVRGAVARSWQSSCLIDVNLKDSDLAGFSALTGVPTTVGCPYCYRYRFSVECQ